MAFSLGASNSAAGGTPAELGPELSDVYTDEIGFKGVSAKLFPPPTSSLLAVAQSKGLVVGAGPDCLVIATTDSIRQAIATSEGDQNSKTKAFQPQATIPLPTRPTHVAFSASEDALILATEGGSQISVFETATLLQGNSQPALSVPTNGVSIRALAPNPDPTSTFAALVTVNGELLMADLKAASLISGPSGSVLRNAVSCVSWSNKGKQLVAGLADGSADQMTADGTSKAQIPRPSDLEGECHGELQDELFGIHCTLANESTVSSIAWLENDVFFMIYTPNGLEDDMGGNPQSHYYIITRRKQAPFLIQKMPEICNTMGFSIKRAPAYQFIARLRDFQPHLRDVLMVSSTLSTDVGLIARSDKPLAHDEAAKSVVGQFTVAEVNDDTKRAALPLAENSDETSVIGLSTDLTSRDNVIAPLQGEDIAESSSPLPALFLLNNQGHLAAWWFVYSESVRQKVPYPGLVSPQQSASGNTPSLGAPAFGKPGGSTFGSTSTMGATAFGRPSAPAFGSPGQLGGSAPAFGQPSAPVSSFGKSSGPAFGSSSQLGGPSPAFGQPSAPAPSFGTPSAPGSGFGSSGLAKPQFGQSGFGTGGSTFGQTSTPAKSLLGSASDGGGFGSFSGGAGGGFGSLAAAKPGDSALGSKSDAPTPFGKGSGFGTGGFGSFSGGAGGQSAFAQSSNSTAFGAQQQTDSPFAPKPNAPKNPFGKSTGGFVLGSSFKPDGTAANDGPKPDKPSSGAFSFGGSFDEIVSSPSKPSPPAESMDDEADVPTPASQPPAKTEPASIFGAPSKPSAPTTSLFGNLTTQPSKPPAESNKSSFSLFGSSSTAQTSAQTNTQTTQNQVTSPLSAPSDKTATPKREQSVSTPTFPSLEAPLPPDSTTRASYAPGDTSASSNVSKSSVEDAPFPPDFISSKSTPKHDDAPLPPDFLSKPKKAEAPPPVPEDAPLPPDPTTRKAKSETSAAIPEDAPLPPDPTTTKVKVESPPAVPEDAPLPPDPTAAKKLPPKEAVPVPDDSGSEQDADESDFSDSGEEITHEETKIPSPKPSAESSFGGLSDKSSTGGCLVE
ncbi:hypothetical protein N7512_000288 [Penicillium capsulatum]|nr:hypothetical protein N7512_000288 [Penicillium capsulatum]